MLSSLGWLVCFWVRMDVLGTVPFGQPAFTGSVVIWMDDILALAVMWLSRMSFMLSLSRISPCRLSIVRKLPFLGSVLFLLMWALLLVERIYYYCWYMSSGMDKAQQFWGQTITATVLASETISNVVMAVTPMFRIMEGSVIGVHCRRLLLLLLSGLTIVVATSIIHAVFWVHGSAPLPRDLTAIIQSGVSLIFADFVVAAIHLCRTYGIAYPGYFGFEVSLRSPVIHLNEIQGGRIGLQCRTPQTGNLVHMGLQRFDSKSHTSKVEDSAKVLSEVNLQASVPLNQSTQSSCIGTMGPSSRKSLPAAAIAKDAGNPEEVKKMCMEGTSYFAAWALVSTLFPSLRANGFRKGAHQSNLKVDLRDWGVGACYVVLLLDLCELVPGGIPDPGSKKISEVHTKAAPIPEEARFISATVPLPNVLQYPPP
ncbi:hypothetical protein EDD85DRAFT_793348 [Armillaria nabsnona]|nr:hypothetical protein EDD85DRAFT_793348 [Armillaria nabsnona]